MTTRGGLYLNRFRSRPTRMERISGSSELQHVSLFEPNDDRPAKPNRRLSTKTVYRIAQTRPDRLAAYRLVYRTYLKHGFTQPISRGMRVTPYHALSSTDVFIAVQAGRTVCTMTLVKDGDLGLPAESLYSEEIKRFRDRGSTIGEVGSLAQQSKNFPVLLRLINLTSQTARFRGLDYILVTVHPRHAKFYQRFLGFESIGPLRSHQAVCGHPAVAMAVNLKQLPVRDPRACGHLFGAPFPLVELMTTPMSAQMRAEVCAWAQEDCDQYEPSFGAVGD